MPYVPAERGRAIREAYEDLGLTREVFASRTGIPAKTLTNITCGKRICSRANAARIASSLPGWSISDVFSELEVAA